MGRLGNASGQAGAVAARPIANTSAAAARLTGIEFIAAILLRLAVGQTFWHKPSGTNLHVRGKTPNLKASGSGRWSISRRATLRLPIRLRTERSRPFTA